jgi:hypothetical protein
MSMVDLGQDSAPLVSKTLAEDSTGPKQLQHSKMVQPGMPDPLAAVAAL